MRLGLEGRLVWLQFGLKASLLSRSGGIFSVLKGTRVPWELFTLLPGRKCYHFFYGFQQDMFHEVAAKFAHKKGVLAI